MSTNKMWMVRAGEGAYLIDEFKENSIVAIGWNEMGNLASVNDPNEIKIVYQKVYRDDSQGQININAGQIRRFRFDFQKSDRVITYNPDERVYYIGEIISDYLYNKKICESFHIRKVKWIGEVKRDRLSTSTKNTLGAISTIFEIGDDAKEEILALLEGNLPITEDQDIKDAELDILKDDMIIKSHEFIKDKVLDLNWDEMQELVAGLLRGMGYKTIVSPKGGDRGRDILASPDGLGLKEPRIVVEVKHRGGQIGSQEIRGFTGGLRPGDKGLYVSTGGFSKEAKYEAERSNIPVTLIDSDLLINLIIQYYDMFDSETKTLVPLIKIYWPA